MGAKESRADIVGVPEKNRVWLLKHPKLQGRGFMYDFLFYARNAHPLASICLSHKAHPYSKCERVVVEALLLVLAWGNACLINVAAWSGCVCPDDPLYDTPEQIECRDGTATLVLSVLNAFSLVLLGTLLKACATCGCVQSHHESDKELAQRGAHIAEGTGSCMICMQGCFVFWWSLTYTALFLMACPSVETYRSVFETFVLGKVISWFMWFITSGIPFSLSWWCISKREDSIKLMELVEQGKASEYLASLENPGGAADKTVDDDDKATVDQTEIEMSPAADAEDDAKAAEETTGDSEAEEPALAAIGADAKPEDDAVSAEHSGSVASDHDRAASVEPDDVDVAVTPADDATSDGDRVVDEV